MVYGLHADKNEGTFYQQQNKWTQIFSKQTKVLIVIFTFKEVNLFIRGRVSKQSHIEVKQM
jgi:hypothetical protein